MPGKTPRRRLNAQLRDEVRELAAVNDELASLLRSTDVAFVLVDADFHVRRFTTAAGRLLNLRPSDLGRPVHGLATNLVDLDLAQEARTVLASQTPVEKDVPAHDGKHYLVRIFPYRAQEQSAQGVVLTLVDVTALKKATHDLHTTQEHIRQLNQTLEQRVAERTKWLTLLHDVTRDINDASSWDEALYLVLRRVCETERWQVGCVYLPDRDAPDTIVPAISCFTEERFVPFHDASRQQRYAAGQSLPGRVFRDGAPLWVNDHDELLRVLPIRREQARQAGLKAAAALPIRFGQEVIAVLELFSDREHAPGEVLSDLMNDVGVQIGKVLERERTSARMADLLWREQQGLLYTLHDSLGQTLTGLGMLSSGLSQRLSGSDAAAADTAQQIARQAQQALDQVRQLARGLFPIEVDAKDLVSALQQLAATTQSLHNLRVHVEGTPPASLRDGAVATELYRIAQEAVTNAVKHAKARTITIHIHGEPGLTLLRIIDDGLGIQNTVHKHDGVGLGIMKYRATSIGGNLTVAPGADAGTVVTCTVRGVPHLTTPYKG